MVGLVIAILYGAGRCLLTGEPFYVAFLGAAHFLLCWYITLTILWFLAVGVDIIRTGGREMAMTAGGNVFLKLAGRAAIRGCFIGGAFLLSESIETGAGAVRWLWPNILAGGGLFLMAFAMSGSLLALETGGEAQNQKGAKK